MRAKATDQMISFREEMKSWFTGYKFIKFQPDEIY